MERIRVLDSLSISPFQGLCIGQCSGNLPSPPPAPGGDDFLNLLVRENASQSGLRVAGPFKLHLVRCVGSISPADTFTTEGTQHFLTPLGSSSLPGGDQGMKHLLDIYQFDYCNCHFQMGRRGSSLLSLWRLWSPTLLHPLFRRRKLLRRKWYAQL